MLKAKAEAAAAKKKAEDLTEKADKLTIQASVRAAAEKKCLIKKTKAADVKSTNEVQLSAARGATNTHIELFCKNGAEKQRAYIDAMREYNELLPADSKVSDSLGRTVEQLEEYTNVDKCIERLMSQKTNKSCGWKSEWTQYIPTLEVLNVDPPQFRWS